MTAPGWRDALRAARRELQVSQRELAQATGIAVDTLRAYETGRRRPSRDHLEAIISALNITAAAANDIREGLGFAARPSVYVHGKERNFYTRDEVTTHIETLPWPCFVVDNDAAELVAANIAAQALWDIDVEAELRRRDRAQLALLAIVAERRFASRIRNWDEVVDTLVSVFKAQRPEPFDLGGDNPWFQRVLAQFAQGDPEFVRGLLDAWQRTPAGTFKYRWEYSVTWDEPGHGVMNFLSIVSVANEPDALIFNDWIPIDAESWSVLERLRGRRGG